jgi:hypothetical protein
MMWRQKEECDKQRGRPVRQGEFWERQEVAISEIATRTKVFKL